MKVIKPLGRSKFTDLQYEDKFTEQSHGMIGTEFTLCGVACEEWDYTNYEEVKKITCNECLEIIKECKSYKG